LHTATDMVSNTDMLILKFPTDKLKTYFS